MVRVSKLMAVLLLALWLPASQHCTLELMGVFACMTCPDHCAGNQSNQNGCGAVENGAYKPASDSLKVPAPTLLASVCQVISFVPAVVCESTGLSGERAEAPQDWITIWHFVRRAAPLPGAPSALLA